MAEVLIRHVYLAFAAAFVAYSSGTVVATTNQRRTEKLHLCCMSNDLFHSYWYVSAIHAVTSNSPFCCNRLLPTLFIPS